MTDEQYIQTQSQILLFARVVRNMPLEAFLHRIDGAESLGPVVQPTLYREAAPNLKIIRELAEGLAGFQRAAERAAKAAAERCQL